MQSSIYFRTFYIPHELSVPIRHASNLIHDSPPNCFRRPSPTKPSNNIYLTIEVSFQTSNTLTAATSDRAEEGFHLNPDDSTKSFRYVDFEKDNSPGSISIVAPAPSVIRI